VQLRPDPHRHRLPLQHHLKVSVPHTSLGIHCTNNLYRI
jgi:hypothetical protein